MNYKINRADIKILIQDENSINKDFLNFERNNIKLPV